MLHLARAANLHFTFRFPELEHLIGALFMALRAVL